MNTASWIVLIILILIVLFVVYSMVKKSKNGISPTCSCGCSNCGTPCKNRKN